jgi:hypothetical protein
VVSLFVQVTVVPTATVIGLGAYAVVVSVEEPLTIDMALELPPDGVVGEEDELQAAVKATAAIANRTCKRIRYLPLSAWQTACPVIVTS